mmetsp:Transcript_166/g.222  ORF Transcript_166/g.222 Transcript_166/m.222 type:complete len:371 (+) Transcript_166:3-1115(+)|eukprot:CAMPEP_0196133826 /NCGR_PEP_ID=MMETSP0910-20130528/2878_1 /TAXON_ID=49265 /ORGANISM="Thalassiosira rotula, Strain GSO102" /LENGTH=370 /DNA_ID=CAMNT_0041393579 /DNA_START=139 /DNA_END=1251 /DNA_ORIENTATION=-
MTRWFLMLLCHAIWRQVIPAACGFSFTSRCGNRGSITASSFRKLSNESDPRQRPALVAFEGGYRARQRATVASLAAAPTTVVNLDVTASSSAAAVAVIDFYANLDNLYDRSSTIKCPFFRRRAADLIDNAAMVAQFLLIRHKSLPGISDLFLDNDPTEDSSPSPVDELLSASVSETIMNAFSAPGCKPLGRHIKRHPDGTARKTRGLPLSDIAQRIRADWTGGTAGEGKGYYITGKLDSTIYRDDCLFTGPDPDMPVRGLRKYLSAAAHLFDPRQSDATLLSMEFHENGGEKGYGMVEVNWRLGGVIQLPWHPTVEPWTGTTFYHLDEEGLIYLHEEGWDISVWRAFICTLFPEAKNWRIWDMERITIHV